MKTIKLMLVVLLMTTFTSCDILSGGVAVPDEVKKVFRSMYPDAWAVEWEMEQGKIVVDYRDGLYERESWFDYDGTWIQTRTDLRVKDLPKQVVEAALTFLGSGWYIEDAESREQNDTPSFYYVLDCERAFHDHETTLYVAPDGTVLDGSGLRFFY